ncbi:MAG: ATP-binding cassette domain-containing protein [Candidatus Peribacteraceae bacterium]|nr:ATP-binding cassette domain-containing protein [Candidatus Peribacteraceae bacterium]
MPGTDAIVVRSLVKSFKKVNVLEGITFSVPRGTMLALLGPNGAGKTTTIRILSTLLRPDGGEVRVNGFDVVREADAVRAVIGLTGQYAAVDEYLTGRENLEMMGRLYHLSAADSRRRATELLEQFDLADAAKRASKTYSGGMRRRLDLAASLVAAPPILFLDEPTTGLDPRSRLMMWDVIGKLLHDGATILLTTQYLEEADKLANRIAVMDRGRVIAEGTAAELKSKVGKDRLELTLERENDLERAGTSIERADVTLRTEERSVSVAIDRVEDVQHILNRLENAGITVAGLSLHKPTLDDVFLQLTGREPAGRSTASRQAEEKKEPAPVPTR